MTLRITRELLPRRPRFRAMWSALRTAFLQRVFKLCITK
jgi:hypothetical protein